MVCVCVHVCVRASVSVRVLCVYVWCVCVCIIGFHGYCVNLVQHRLEKHNARVPALLLLKPRDLAEPAKLMPGKFTEDNMKTFFKQGTQPRMVRKFNSETPSESMQGIAAIC